MYLYFIIFLLLVYFCLIKKNKIELPLFICAGTLLFFLAAFRAKGIDKDYIGYIEYYNDILYKSFVNVEPSFILITILVEKIFHNYIFIFIFYALLGISLKFLAIYKLTRFRLLSVLVYYSLYFLLFEMTQIRVGVAAGFMLLCIIPIKERKLGLFLFYSTLAFLFHYSAIIIFPLYFLSSRKINIYIYSLLIPIAYLIYFSNLNLFFFSDYISIPLIQTKLGNYNNYASIDSSINLFNYVHIFRCLLVYLFLWKWKVITTNNTYAVIVIKIYIIALFIFVAMAKIPGISSRLSEFLLIVEIIMIPYLLIAFKSKSLAISLVTAISFAFFCFSIFYTKLLIF